MEPAGSVRDPARARADRRLLLAAGALTAALTAVSSTVALQGSGEHAGLVAFVRASMVCLPMAAGMYAWHRRPSERFGPLLIAAGGLWFVTTLAESSDELLYSVGRVAGWMFEVVLIYLVLSFPTGRLAGRADRLLVAAGAVIVCLLYLPTVLLVEGFPVPSQYTSCTEHCPPNAFLVVDTQPAFVDDVVRPVRELLTIVLFVAVTARLTLRVRMASPLLRRTLTPLLTVAIARSLVLALALAGRLVAPRSQLVIVGAWILALAVPAMALAFLAGLLRWKVFVADALQTIGARLHARPDLEALRDAFAEAFDDPSVELAVPVDDGRAGWVDAAGRPIESPEPSAARHVGIADSGGVPTAAIICDGALRDQPALIEAATAHVALVLDNRRLAAEIEASTRDLREARSRVVHHADRERLEIERNLHDGAQQRLVALHIELNLAEEELKRDPRRGPELLRELGRGVDEALDEIRSLARGIYPPLLADRGLAEALRTAALRSPLTTIVRPTGIGRYPPEVESAVYFCVVEAMQNAAKHAEGARHVVVSLHGSEALHFEVRDDGQGFDADCATAGVGLTNMRDRMAAVGGEVRVHSVPGQGTTVSGTVPLP